MLKRDVMYPAVVTKEDGVYYIGLVDFDRLEDGNINYYATYSEDLEKVSTAIRVVFSRFVRYEKRISRASKIRRYKAERKSVYSSDFSRSCLWSG